MGENGQGDLLIGGQENVAAVGDGDDKVGIDGLAADEIAGNRSGNERAGKVGDALGDGDGWGGGNGVVGVRGFGDAVGGIEGDAEFIGAGGHAKGQRGGERQGA